MAWEVSAIWVIVIVAITWFMRDEKRLRLERLRERAQHFALAPRYRYETPPVPEQPAMPLPRLEESAASRESRRRFLAAMQR